MKDILTFNKHHEIKAKIGEFPLKVLEDKLIEDLLNKGYLPKSVRSGFVKKLSPFYIEPIEFDYAVCESCYVGKKQARILYEKHKDLLEVKKVIKNV